MTTPDTRLRGIVGMAICALLMAGTASADMPTAFIYQGQLSDGGSPANGSHDFIFDLYSEMTSGSAAHTMSTNGVTVTDGYFDVYLDFGDSAFTGNFWALEIRVRPSGGGAYETLSPRQPILPTPYAMCADSVTDGAVTSAKLGPDAVTADKIQDGAVTNAKLGPLVVTADKIQNAVVTSVKLGPLAVTNGKIATDAVTGTKIADGAVDTDELATFAATDAKIATNAITRPKIADGAVATDELADDAVTGAKIAAGTITAANVATDGGIYSSKSRIYEATGEAAVQVGFCVQVMAQCNDANDLPLMGLWSMPPGSDIIVRSTSTEDWDNLAAPAEFKAEMCFLSGASAITVRAGIMCVEVD